MKKRNKNIKVKKIKQVVNRLEKIDYRKKKRRKGGEEEKKKGRQKERKKERE